MSTADRSQLLRVLQGHRDAVVDSWYKALTRTDSFAPLKAAEVRQRLVELTDQAIALLLADPFERSKAQAIGAALARLRCVQPEALGRTQEILAHRLVEGLLAEQVVALQPRLAALLGGLAAGFFQQACETILAEQERIRDALVTELQRAEESLRESEQTAWVLLNAPTHLALLADPDGTIVALNEAACKSLGKSSNELVGTCVFDLFTRDVVERRKGVIEKVIHSGKPARFEDEREGRWFDQSAYPVFDAQGKAVRFAVIARDITGRKKAEKALRDHAERLKILHEIDSATLAARSSEEVACTVVGYLRQRIPCLGASVVLFDFEAREGVVLVADVTGKSMVRGGTCFSLDALEGAERVVEALRRGRVCVTQRVHILVRAIPELRALQAGGLRAALIVPLIVRGELIGFLGLGAERFDVFGASQVKVARELAGPLAIAIQHARLFESVIQQRQQLRALTARLAEAEETERRRLARRLHDLVGRNLTALGLNLNLVQTHLPEEAPELVRSCLDDSLALVEETVEQVRHVMADLRPPMLDDYGLVATLQWYGGRFTSWTGIAVTVFGEEPAPRLAPPAENALFRIAQEALTNVGKHAQATQVTVTVAADDEAVRMIIADDGVGFDPVQVSRPGGRQGWGLLTMTERIEAVGGCCRIESRSQQGTQVIVEVAR
jgi:PAS domain S-box-containing protein